MLKLFNCTKVKKNSEDDVDAYIFNNVKPEIKSPSVFKISRRTNETHYKNDHPNIGIAVIFNHINVAGHSQRLGTEKDKDRVENVLNSFGFDVRSYDDLKFEEIKKILKSVSEEDHSNNDCLVIVVMSHGITGHICATDHPYLAENLWTPFMGENCKTLINKPKLFFIQACRGQKADVGAVFNTRRRRSITPDLGNDDIDCQTTYTIPSTADTFLFYATFEGYVSFRSKSDGSWFIQSLAFHLEEYVKKKQSIDLYHFVTSVNRRVAYEYQSNVPNNQNLDEMKAMPNFVSTLTKLFILKPKPKPKSKSNIKK